MLILVVDDEESLCDLLAEILADQYEILKAYDGLQAWELVRENHPDLVITDVMMPRMSGLDLLSAMRSDTATRAIPVVLVSAVSLPSPNLAKDAAAFLSKPFDIDVVEQTVSNIIQQKSRTPSSSTSSGSNSKSNLKPLS